MTTDNNERRLTSGSEKTSRILEELTCPHFDVREESTGFPLSGMDDKCWYALMVHCKKAIEGSDTYCVGHINRAPIVDATISPQAVRRCPLYERQNNQG